MTVLYNHPLTEAGIRYETLSNSITFMLEKGDQVFVHLLANTWVFDNKDNVTLFTGHLVFPLWPSFYSFPSLLWVNLRIVFYFFLKSSSFSQILIIACVLVYLWKRVTISNQVCNHFLWSLRAWMWMCQMSVQYSICCITLHVRNVKKWTCKCECPVYM